MKSLARHLRSTEAAEIAEAALVLPVVFLFLLGIVWFGRAFNIYSTIQQAAQQGALLAARPTCATCGSTFAGGNKVDKAVEAVMKASSVNPSLIIDPGATPANCTKTADDILLCRDVVINNTPGSATYKSCGTPPDPSPSQICGSIVTFKYPFQFSLPYTSLNWTTITLTAQAQSRKEN